MTQENIEMTQKNTGRPFPVRMSQTDLRLMLDYLRKSSAVGEFDGRATEDKLLTSLALHLRNNGKPC